MIRIDDISDEEIPALLVGLAGRLLKKKPEPSNGHAPDRLLSLKEAAERLGVSKSHLYHVAKDLPFVVPIGRRVMFSEKGIERYIQEHVENRT